MNVLKKHRSLWLRKDGLQYLYVVYSIYNGRGWEISFKVLDYIVTEKHLAMFKMYIEIHCRVIYFEHNKHCKI